KRAPCSRTLRRAGREGVGIDARVGCLVPRPDGQVNVRRVGGRRLDLPGRKWAIPWLAAALLLGSSLQPVAAAKPPPDTIIDSGPAALTTTTTATFTFHSTTQGATFSCRLDGGTAAACASPKAYPGLAAGAHTFAVVSTANGATDPTPASGSWTIDLSPPTA